MSTIKQKLIDKVNQIIAGIVDEIHIDTDSHAEGLDMLDWLYLENKFHELKQYVQFRVDLKGDRRIDKGIRETLIDQIMKDEE